MAYINETTSILTQYLDRNKFKYTAELSYGVETVKFHFAVGRASDVMAEFFNIGDDIPLAILVFPLSETILPEQRVRMLEVCNVLNGKYPNIWFRINGRNRFMLETRLPEEYDRKDLEKLVDHALDQVITALTSELDYIQKSFYLPDVK